ncbi:MAG: hypothetical protein WC677_07705 [Clostridia bacterium]|jgi:hypothetical protein
MKFTKENLLQFEKEYWAGDYPSQRYGQAASNYFEFSEEDCPGLFYSEDAGDAIWLLWSKLHV